MFDSFPSIWKDRLPAGFFERQDMLELEKFVDSERQRSIVYPSVEHVWSALEICGFDDVRVVILGQDPYHGPGQAHGLCFSVRPGVKKPPSLLNIFKELSRDLQCPIPSDGTLTSWGKQGVLLLNTVMTVREGAAGSHQGRGWEALTDALIDAIQRDRERVVFVLWGAHAQNKAQLIDARHLILRAPHPSPLSAHRGFLGCGHFSAINEWLLKHHERPIAWCDTP